jgi:hypothetical protein
MGAHEALYVRKGLHKGIVDDVDVMTIDDQVWRCAMLRIRQNIALCLLYTSTRAFALGH